MEPNEPPLDPPLQSTVPVGIVIDNGVEVLVGILVIDGDTGDYISKEYTIIIHTSCCYS